MFSRLGEGTGLGWVGVGVASVPPLCGSGVSGLLVVEGLGHGPFGNCGETCVDEKKGGSPYV